MKLQSVCLLCVLSLAALVSGCAMRGAEVVDARGYAQLVRCFPAAMQERGFADKDLRYTDVASLGNRRYGEILYRQLSPDFGEAEAGHDIYFGETFHGTLTPMSHYYPDRDGQGFSIVHPSQKLAVRMLAVLDWNGDGKDEWLVRTRIETYRGGRVRDYYLLVPVPENVRAMVHATVMATADSCGVGLPSATRLRSTAGFGKKDTMAPTIVEEKRPGQGLVTTPPSGKTSDGIASHDL